MTAAPADEEAVLRAVLEATARETGKAFFRALVASLARTLGTSGAWLTEYFPEQRRLRTRAFWMDGEIRPDWELPIAGTPCEVVIDRCDLVHYPERLADLFPGDSMLARHGAVSYLGVPVLDVDDSVMGHLAVIDTRPMADEPRHLTVFRLFAARAASELRRLRDEEAARRRGDALGRLFEGSADGIVELDADLNVVRMNPAAARWLGDAPPGARFAERLHPGDVPVFEGLAASGKAEAAATLRPARGGEALEARLLRMETAAGRFFALVLRDSDRRLRAMTAEVAVLQRELSPALGPDQIVGASAPLARALEEVRRVAPTEATVLILGETGTGKELFAKAVHAGSRRKGRALVRINCAAVPATLMESEFFGHEKGAFTGATSRREGRFALADGGTLFLDEVGDLPPDLQAKLLRVLQEGEFEPVGSSATRKVDVRVVAATHRDLGAAVREGTFREDLYYRLNVFPLRLPPLRERGDDVLLLAERFCREMAATHGRPVPALDDEVRARLRAHAWPGNVRELRNVLERALILGADGALDLSDALPGAPAAAPVAAPTLQRVHTARELEDLERRNLLLALEETGGRIWGEKGAARLLDVPPTTLHSRLKALGVARPAEV